MRNRLIRATQENIPDIQAMAQAIWPAAFAAILSPSQITYMMDFMYDAYSIARQMDLGHIFLMVQIDGLYKGYCSYELGDFGNPYTKVHKLYISATLRGQGQGTEILNHVEELSRLASKKGVRLNVNRNNPALDFYLDRGYRLVGEVDIPIGGGYLMEDYILEKNLSG